MGRWPVTGSARRCPCCVHPSSRDESRRGRPAPPGRARPGRLAARWCRPACRGTRLRRHTRRRDTSSGAARSHTPTDGRRPTGSSGAGGHGRRGCRAAALDRRDRSCRRSRQAASSSPGSRVRSRSCQFGTRRSSASCSMTRPCASKTASWTAFRSVASIRWIRSASSASWRPA